MNQKHSKEYKSIGQTIKKYRKLRGLTQEQLADMVCISISYLTKIEAPNCDQPFSLEVIWIYRKCWIFPFISYWKMLNREIKK